MDIDRLIAKVESYNPSASLAIREAYSFAEEVHRNQMRLSNEPYITHPLWVAYILAELHLDTPTIIAGLLHDSLENTLLTKEDLRERFTEEIVNLIEGVSRMSEVARTSREEERIGSLRKMLIAMARDIRVVLIKLADRLHNMRTLSFLDPNLQLMIAQETLEIYAPLAHRLGMGRIKAELEDLAFMYLEPKAYHDLKDKVDKTQPKRAQYIQEVISLLEKELKKLGIEADISGRPKHLYSIYKKMTQQEKEFEEIYDLLAIRVIINSIKDCYVVLGVVHSLFKPIPGRFKDYISMPKSNMYQALHTTVIGPGGRSVEVQIKTEKMHRTAEEGIAAHWYYKEGGTKDKEFDEKLSFLRQLLEWQKESVDPREFIEGLKIDIFADTVFVFTPKGEIRELPRGSTPIDFAYTIHTDIGNHVMAAKVNGKIVPLRYQLESGDRVEIITSPRVHPTQDWLKLVKTPRARARIRRWLNEQIQRSSPPKETVTSPESQGKRGSSIHKVKARSMGIVIAGAEGLNVHLARCCSPVPDDEIIGYITQGRGMISVHRRDCPNIFKLMDTNRMIEVGWDSERKEPVYYKVGITLLARNRANLLADILLAISSTSTLINAADLRVMNGNLARCGFEVAVSDKSVLKRVITEIEKVAGVIEVYRSQPKV